MKGERPYNFQYLLAPQKARSDVVYGPFRSEETVVCNQTISHSRGHATMSGDIFGCHTGDARPASEAGMPLSTLQYTGQRPLQSCLTQS